MAALFLPQRVTACGQTATGSVIPALPCAPDWRHIRSGVCPVRLGRERSVDVLDPAGVIWDERLRWLSTLRQRIDHRF